MVFALKTTKEKNITRGEKALIRRNGITYVELSVNFLHNSTMNWVNCCYALPQYDVCFQFDVVKDISLNMFNFLGLINVFNHFGGNLVFHFRNVKGDEVCVSFSHVSFLYWTVKGLCMLDLAVGTPIAMEQDTHRTVRNEPILEARMLIEVGTLDPLQNFIMVNAYDVNRKFKVMITYERPHICGYYYSIHGGVYPNVMFMLVLGPNVMFMQVLGPTLEHSRGTSNVLISFSKSSEIEHDVGRVQVAAQNNDDAQLDGFAQPEGVHVNAGQQWRSCLTLFLMIMFIFRT
ncbi:hypothetical protein POM88_012731 [Heracleum sosnowskyi]|uniref:Uncharacterized protein n=1 Tax=Heracleum sosnowskyi TaxID=360622 RepID=A0AAD8MXI9_9APIA|nr:hypothetical protein POM88_012731 [Heracleum sosnowskyi]